MGITNVFYALVGAGELVLESTRQGRMQVQRVYQDAVERGRGAVARSRGAEELDDVKEPMQQRRKSASERAGAPTRARRQQAKTPLRSEELTRAPEAVKKGPLDV